MKNFFKDFKEKIIEGLLLISSTVTSFTVLLIVVFLFKEGAGLFTETGVDEGYSLLVNPSNPVSRLEPDQIKKIFDQEITGWKEIGGKAEPIKLFSFNNISEYFSEEELGEEFVNLPGKIEELINAEPGILAFVNDNYVLKNTSAKKIIIPKISILKILSGKEWYPTASPSALFGFAPLILGTLYVSFIAILIALPFGLATAIYLAEVADYRVRNFLKPFIELLAGIPSVVYGFFGLVIIVPLIKELFNLPVGETALAGSIILGIMALPTIITISEDALRTIPRSMKEASLALGANRWQTIVRVVVPYAMSGITAAAILGIGRAMGETMAVLMVTGNAAVIPGSVLEPVRTIPATIAAELGEAPFAGIHYKALFTLGCILFILTLVVNLTVESILSKRKNQSR